MPIYNAGEYLVDAVNSIIAQTYANWELYIIDDGSTDNAIDSINLIKDDRIKILKDGLNKGLAARLNQAIDLANGQYFARMDQDDVSYPERFERQLQILQNYAEVDLVAISAVTISENNQLTGLMPSASSNEAICAKPWRGFYLPHPTWMGKTAWFREYRYANPGPYFCEDQELLLRSYKRSSFFIITEPLFAYRVRKVTNRYKLIKTRWTVLKIQLQYFLPRRQLYFGLMALFTFLGRVLLDSLKARSSIVFPIIKLKDKELLVKWQQVLRLVRSGNF